MMKKTARYTLLLVLGLSTPGLLADDSGEDLSETATPPVSPVPQAPGWEAYAPTEHGELLPTVLDEYKSQVYLAIALDDLDEYSESDDEFKRHWTFKRRLFRFHFLDHKMMGIGYYKDADIKGFTTAIILEWD